MAWAAASDHGLPIATALVACYQGFHCTHDAPECIVSGLGVRVDALSFLLAWLANYPLTPAYLFKIVSVDFLATSMRPLLVLGQYRHR